MISEQAKKIRDGLVRGSPNQDYQSSRLEWENAAKQVPTPEGVEVKTVVIGGLPCMLHATSSRFPSHELVLYIHGGGLIEGSIHTSREWCARVCKASDTTVLSIDYRLAPEHPFPAALNDVLNVFAALNDTWPGCTVKSVGADSSGCSLLLAALFKLRETNSELPLSVFLVSPSVDFLFSGKSYTSNKLIDPLVSKEVLEQCAALYAGDLSRCDPLISPLYGSFESMPPMQIHVDAGEILLDDAISLKAQAVQDGCYVELIVKEGLWHVWPAFGDFPEANEATDNIARHINNAWQQRL